MKSSTRPWGPRHSFVRRIIVGRKAAWNRSTGSSAGFSPKGTNFHELDPGEINRIEKLLNHRPRKCLQYRTPYEVFREARGALDL